MVNTIFMLNKIREEQNPELDDSNFLKNKSE